MDIPNLTPHVKHLKEALQRHADTLNKIPGADRQPARSTAKLVGKAAAWAAAAVGAAAAGAAGTLAAQGAHASLKIVSRTNNLRVPHSDGRYGRGHEDWPDWLALEVLVIGDSMGKGLGVPSKKTLGAIVATQYAARMGGQGINLTVGAQRDSKSTDVLSQVNVALRSGPTPDVTLIVVGTNDVTRAVSLHRQRLALEAAVHTLRKAGCQTVIVCTSGDPGIVQDISRPLRPLLSYRARLHGRQQTDIVTRVGAWAISLYQLSHEMAREPERMFGPDGFHPSGEAYQILAGYIRNVFDRALMPETAVIDEALHGEMPIEIAVHAKYGPEDVRHPDAITPPHPDAELLYSRAAPAAPLLPAEQPIPAMMTRHGQQPSAAAQQPPTELDAGSQHPDGKDAGAPGPRARLMRHLRSSFSRDKSNPTPLSQVSHQPPRAAQTASAGTTERGRG